LGPQLGDSNLVVGGDRRVQFVDDALANRHGPILPGIYCRQAHGGSDQLPPERCSAPFCLLRTPRAGVDVLDGQTTALAASERHGLKHRRECPDVWCSAARREAVTETL